MALHEIIRSLPRIGEPELRIAVADRTLRAAIDPEVLRVVVEAGAAASLVVLHTKASTSAIELEAGEGATLEVVELFTADTFAEVKLRQAAASRVRLTVVEAAAADFRCTADLAGRDAVCETNALLLAGGAEHTELTLRTNHLVADCKSRTQVRGVAGGTATGLFRGLVYVAPDAQRTDAGQQCRNVLVSDTARIDAQPQLEIYADDVQCTHGATVGLLDREAIFYLRQRGLDERQARRLQLAGFVSELLLDCAPEPLCDAVLEAVETRLSQL